MIKKLVSLLGIIIFIMLIIVKINPEFTFTGLLSRLNQFPNLKNSLNSVKLPDIPKIPVPDVIGFKQVVRGINGMIEGVFSLAETTLSLGKIVPNLFKSIISLFAFIFGF